ncbi:MAG: hypothetical protein HC771_16705 [Synechococcales cyanobacterium CRU_2_2]|nr:hypothetical protein [Synechococcales cyanobacterium CRU_2_2]
MAQPQEELEGRSHTNQGKYQVFAKSRGFSPKTTHPDGTKTNQRRKPTSAEKPTSNENQPTGIDQMQGWVERYQPDAELQQMLKTLPPQ